MINEKRLSLIGAFAIHQKGRWSIGEKTNGRICIFGSSYGDRRQLCRCREADGRTDSGLSFLRIAFLIASVVLLTLLFCIEKGLPALTKKDVLVLLVQSFTGVFLFSICLLYGVQYTTGTESGILTSTTPW